MSFKIKEIKRRLILCFDVKLAALIWVISDYTLFGHTNGREDFILRTKVLKFDSSTPLPFLTFLCVGRNCWNRKNPSLNPVHSLWKLRKIQFRNLIIPVCRISYGERGSFSEFLQVLALIFSGYRCGWASLVFTHTLTPQDAI
jgi:hypothetical protein